MGHGGFGDCAAEEVGCHFLDAGGRWFVLYV